MHLSALQQAPLTNPFLSLGFCEINKVMVETLNTGINISGPKSLWEESIDYRARQRGLLSLT